MSNVKHDTKNPVRSTKIALPFCFRLGAVGCVWVRPALLPLPASEAVSGLGLAGDHRLPVDDTWVFGDVLACRYLNAPGQVKPCRFSAATKSAGSASPTSPWIVAQARRSWSVSVMTNPYDLGDAITLPWYSNAAPRASLRECSGYQRKKILFRFFIRLSNSDISFYFLFFFPHFFLVCLLPETFCTSQLYPLFRYS